MLNHLRKYSKVLISIFAVCVVGLLFFQNHYSQLKTTVPLSMQALAHKLHPESALYNPSHGHDQQSNDKNMIIGRAPSIITKPGCSEKSIQDLIARKSKSGIPLIIHIIYANSKIPEQYYNFLKHCQKLNPDFTYLLWTDDSARRFIQSISSEQLKFYNSYSFDLQRSDVLRYFFLYYIGGFYMDMDVECLKPIRPLLDKHECFLDREREIQSQILYDRPYIAMNSGMGCKPKHPYLKMVLDALPEFQVKNPNAVLETTGPIFITETFKRYTSTHSGNEDNVVVLPAAVLSPNLDPASHIMPRLRKICEDQQTLKTAKWTKVGCTSLEKDNFVDSVSESDKEMTLMVHKFMHIGHFGGKRQVFKYIDLCKSNETSTALLMEHL